MNEIETFAIPCAGAIIVRNINNILHILLQTRCKDRGYKENGLIEIPAGKIREYENVYATLKREISEETGLTLDYVLDQDNCFQNDDSYMTQSFSPFCITQNLKEGYSIILMTFICRCSGSPLNTSEEATNIHWVSIDELKQKLKNNSELFYPMHLNGLNKFIKEYTALGTYK